MLAGQNPEAIAGLFAQRNPQFARFLQECGNMTPEQICQKYGLDWNQVRQALG